MSILTEIARRKRWERNVLRDALKGHMRERPGEGFLPDEATLKLAFRLLKAGGCEAVERREWEGSLADAEHLTVIAEVKRRSPSAGSFASWSDPAELATVYAEGGAAAVSCLTDAHFFDGRPSFLPRCREVFSGPVLRKDFLDDELDLAISAALGADAILLIVSMLGPRTGDLIRLARAYDLGVLVEVHDERELEMAMVAGAPVIGINNRNLSTFRTDLGTTERLAERIPPGVVLVAESGVKGVDDARRMRRAGAHAVLVGEALARSGGAGLKDLQVPEARGGRGGSETRMQDKELEEMLAASGLVLPPGLFGKKLAEVEELQVKVCGLTRIEDVHDAAAAGATHVGFVLAPSKRRVADLRDLQVLCGEAHDMNLVTVGVFVNADVSEVRGVASRVGLDVVQLHGDEEPAAARALVDAGLTVWKALPVHPGFRSEDADSWWAAGVEAVLLDRWHPQQRGGTGEALDPAIAAEVALRGPVMLAGGLSGDNVADRVARVRPWGVDASSKLETAPGLKDPDLVAAFVQAALETSE